MNWTLLPFDKDDHGHRDFVLDGFAARNTRVLCTVPQADPAYLFQAALRHPATRLVLAANPANLSTLVAWAAVNDQARAIVCAVTRYRLRHQGIGTWLLTELGYDLLTPTPVLIWSPAASRIAAKGIYRIYPLPLDDWAERTSLTRGENP